MGPVVGHRSSRNRFGQVGPACLMEVFGPNHRNCSLVVVVEVGNFRSLVKNMIGFEMGSVLLHLLMVDSSCCCCCTQTAVNVNRNGGGRRLLVLPS